MPPSLHRASPSSGRARTAMPDQTACRGYRLPRSLFGAICRPHALLISCDLQWCPHAVPRAGVAACPQPKRPRNGWAPYLAVSAQIPPHRDNHMENGHKGNGHMGNGHIGNGHMGNGHMAYDGKRPHGKRPHGKRPLGLSAQVRRQSSYAAKKGVQRVRFCSSDGGRAAPQQTQTKKRCR